MNNIASLLHSTVEAHPRSKLSQLEYEQLPNEFRNLPRLPEPERRRAPITRVSRIEPLTREDWKAWGI